VLLLTFICCKQHGWLLDCNVKNRRKGRTFSHLKYPHSHPQPHPHPHPPTHTPHIQPYFVFAALTFWPCLGSACLRRFGESLRHVTTPLSSPTRMMGHLGLNTTLVSFAFFTTCVCAESRCEKKTQHLCMEIILTGTPKLVGKALEANKLNRIQMVFPVPKPPQAEANSSSSNLKPLVPRLSATFVFASLPMTFTKDLHLGRCMGTKA